MNIVFLCNSLERGCDGVGDYTRSLAGECVKRGGRCLLIALNDRRCSDIIREPVAADGGERSEDTHVQVLRLPSVLSWEERERSISAELAKFSPNVVSLQFVPYGLQDRGLITPQIRRVVAGIAARADRRHIMFHELWVGEGENEKLTNRIMGQLQKYLILRLAQCVHPHSVNTSNTTYVRRTQRLFPKYRLPAAQLLPLFGNIPVLEPDHEWFREQVVARGGPADFGVGDRGRFLIVGSFGTMKPSSLKEEFFTGLRKATQDSGRRAVFLSVGRKGAEGSAAWERLSQLHADWCLFVDFGEQPGNRISQCLGELDLGMAMSPLDILGKSGTVAAMLEHGVPVVVTRRGTGDVQESVKNIDRGRGLVYMFDEQFPARLSAGIPRGVAKATLPPIADSFLASLGGAASTPLSEVQSAL